MLNALLRPRAIAIVGASARADGFGQQLLTSIESLGYEGEIFLINPKYNEIKGRSVYPHLADLPQPVDCVAMAVSDASLPQQLALAAQAKARSAVLFGRAHGQTETGENLMHALARIAREGDMQLCGANCMGFVNLEDKLQMTGFPFSTLKEPGNVALISHSGSTWSGIVGNLRQLRFNFAISAGQELATGVAEYIDFLVAQPSTRVICLVLETVRQPEAFLAALQRATARDIVVIALKLGRSVQGQIFAQSHSGAMSGSADVYDAIFERHGVINVRSLDELMDTAELFAAERRPHNGLIGLGCDSGGERQLIADLSEPLQLPFAPLSPETVTRLEALLDQGIEATNPLDYWGDGKDVIAPALLALADDPQVGTLVMATNIPDGQNFTNVCTHALQAVWGIHHQARRAHGQCGQHHVACRVPALPVMGHPRADGHRNRSARAQALCPLQPACTSGCAATRACESLRPRARGSLAAETAAIGPARPVLAKHGHADRFWPACGHQPHRS